MSSLHHSVETAADLSMVGGGGGHGGGVDTGEVIRQMESEEVKKLVGKQLSKKKKALRNWSMKQEIKKVKMRSQSF